MKDNVTECPNCRAKIKEGIVTSNRLLDASQISIIKEFTSDKGLIFCNKCGDKLLEKSRSNIIQEKAEYEENIKKLVKNIPIVSIHSPIHWDYDVIGIVTGQSATGTGVFSEFASSFTDFFGGQSGTINNKLRGGEYICFTQLRINTLDRKGNAVVGVDIDYSELGGGKGIIMVCMTGTAIRLKNTEILGEDIEKNLVNLSESHQRIRYLSKLL